MSLLRHNSNGQFNACVSGQLLAKTWKTQARTWTSRRDILVVSGRNVVNIFRQPRFRGVSRYPQSQALNIWASSLVRQVSRFIRSAEELTKDTPSIAVFILNACLSAAIYTDSAVLCTVWASALPAAAYTRTYVSHEAFYCRTLKTHGLFQDNNELHNTQNRSRTAHVVMRSQRASP